jgi:hypothetical protein
MDMRPEIRRPGLDHVRLVLWLKFLQGTAVL